MARGSVIEEPTAVLAGSVRRRQTSPEAAAAMMHLRRAGIASVVMFGVAWIPGHIGALLGSVFGVVAVTELIRSYLPHITLPRAWVLVFALSGVLALIPVASGLGRALFVLTAIGFFLFRRHRVYRVLDSRQRAAVFAGSFVFLVLAALAPDLPEPPGTVGEILHGVSASAWFTLIFGAVMGGLHLFLGIRLHFLRLRPKLAVAGFLLAAVPVTLIAVLGVLLAVGVVGSAHGAHAQGILENWLSILEAGGPIAPETIGPGFGAVGRIDGLEGEFVPDWRDDLGDAVAHAGFDPVPEAFWMRRDGELWAVRTETIEGVGPRLLGARRLDTAAIQRLADQLRCEVGVYVDSEDDGMNVTIGGTELGQALLEGDDNPLRARPSDVEIQEGDGEGWTQRWLVFGAATLEVFALQGSDDVLREQTVFVGLRARPNDLFALLSDPRNQINQAVGVVLLILAILFLVLEAFALYFGLRIVGGITGAVGRLHKATRQLATGDLDVRIDLPNEDEFGELADGFNEMTRAMRLAQDQIAQKQRLEQEIATARQIQLRLLPSEVPQVAGYELAGGSTPSKQVGGDYFDFIPLPDGRLGIAIADVSGKGIPAALLMSNIQASLQGQVLHEAPVTEVVGRMNELLARSTDAHMFATFFYGALDPQSGRIAGVNAGHEPPLIVRADGTMEELPAGGLILGMLPGQTYRECSTVLGPGDSMVLYTDGITEAMGPGTRIPGMDLYALPASTERLGQVEDDDDDDEEIVTNFFGEERLKEIVRARRGESAASIHRAILDGVHRHVRDVPQSDDVTLVVIKRDAVEA